MVRAAEIQHRGKQVRQALTERQALRRASRNRKTRYRQPRFLNRNPQRCNGCGRNARHGSRYCRACGAGDGQRFRDKGLSSSLESRVANVVGWVTPLCQHAPVF
ncbi:RRXRR domain-containing protein [Thermogemmatispora sp.]|uniref:RRXRR domain-containing protein n=1 Tax=Thermogemmatispora sp. TaxID=1968838 RepID=UPI0035E3F51F